MGVSLTAPCSLPSFVPLVRPGTSTAAKVQEQVPESRTDYGAPEAMKYCTCI